MATTIHHLPQEMLHLIFSKASMRTLFHLPFVCGQFNAALTNAFFRERCLKYFRSLGISPQFYEPVEKTVDGQWKWVCFSLSGIRWNQQLFPIAKTLAKLTHRKFKDYLLGKVEEMHAMQPGTQVEQSKEQFFLFWSEEDQKELQEVREEIVLNRPLSQSLHQIYRAVELKYSTAKKSEDRIGIFNEFVQRLEQAGFSARAVQFARLHLKQISAYAPFEELQSIHAKTGHLEQICSDQEGLEDFSAQIFFHVLCSLPHLKKWIPHRTRIDRLRIDIAEEKKDPGASEERLRQMGEDLLALPEPLPEILCDNLHRLHGKSHEKKQWFAAHFHEHLSDLQILLHLHLSDFKELQSNVHPQANPALDLTFLGRFAEFGLIGGRYPHENPFPVEFPEDLSKCDYAT